MKAFILAAGLGTRLRPLTDRLPKALVEVAGEPLLSRTIRTLREAGAADLTVNVHHHAAQVVRYLAAHDFGLPVRISDESDLLRNTGGALRHAYPDGAADDVLVHNVDILSNADFAALSQVHAARRAAATLLVSDRPSSRRLLFSTDPACPRLLGWTDTRTGEVRSPHADLDPASCRSLAFAGIHLLSPALFPLMKPWPESFSIIDFYLKACADHLILGYVQPDLRLLDVGKVDTLAQAENFLLSGTP